MKPPQPKKPANPLHHIRRIDNETNCTHAWYVTVNRNKQRTSTIFSDSVHGDKKKSLQAAIKYRNKLLMETDIYAHLMKGYRTSLRSNNQSGVAGVCRVEKIDKRRPNSHNIYWIAYGKNEFGVKYTRSFSIIIHGYAKARQMAIDERERMLNRAGKSETVHYLNNLGQKITRSAISL